MRALFILALVAVTFATVDASSVIRMRKNEEAVSGSLSVTKVASIPLGAGGASAKASAVNNAQWRPTGTAIGPLYYSLQVHDSNAPYPVTMAVVNVSSLTTLYNVNISRGEYDGSYSSKFRATACGYLLIEVTSQTYHGISPNGTVLYHTQAGPDYTQPFGQVVGFIVAFGLKYLDIRTGESVPPPWWSTAQQRNNIFVVQEEGHIPQTSNGFSKTLVYTVGSSTHTSGSEYSWENVSMVDALTNESFYTLQGPLQSYEVPKYIGSDAFFHYVVIAPSLIPLVPRLLLVNKTENSGGQGFNRVTVNPWRAPGIIGHPIGRRVDGGIHHGYVPTLVQPRATLATPGDVSGGGNVTLLNQNEQDSEYAYLHTIDIKNGTVLQEIDVPTHLYGAFNTMWDPTAVIGPVEGMVSVWECSETHKNFTTYSYPGLKRIATSTNQGLSGRRYHILPLGNSGMVLALENSDGAPGIFKNFAIQVRSMATAEVVFSKQYSDSEAPNLTVAVLEELNTFVVTAFGNVEVFKYEW